MRSASLVKPFDFTKGSPVLRITLDPDIGETGRACVENWHYGSCLFDLKSDPGQFTPLDDERVVARLTAAIIEHFHEHNAPDEVYAHYGIERQHAEAFHAV